MNKSIRIALLTAAAAAACQAAPFMAVGDGAELFATGVLGVRADDNILLTNSNGKTSDTVFDLIPGLELDFGKNSQLQGSLTLADAFTRYGQNSQYNTNLFAGNFVSKFDDGKMKLGLSGGYNELNQNTAELRGLVRRDVGNIATNGEVGVSEITSVGAGVTFVHENYHPTNYVDSDTLSVPLNFYYRWTPKLDLSVGYTYRDYQAKNGLAQNSTDNFYNIGARGEFSPKLTGKLAVGYSQRHISGGGNRGMVGLDSSFAYELTPKTSIEFGAANAFGTSPSGAQQKNLTLNALASTKISEELSLNAGLSYRSISYDKGTVAGHTDDYWEGTIGGAYVINANVKILAAYVYRTYKDNADRQNGFRNDFTNNVFAISANFRY